MSDTDADQHIGPVSKPPSTVVCVDVSPGDQEDEKVAVIESMRSQEEDSVLTVSQRDRVGSHGILATSQTTPTGTSDANSSTRNSMHEGMFSATREFWRINFMDDDSASAIRSGEA